MLFIFLISHSPFIVLAGVALPAQLQLPLLVYLMLVFGTPCSKGYFSSVVLVFQHTSSHFSWPLHYLHICIRHCYVFTLFSHPFVVSCEPLFKRSNECHTGHLLPTKCIALLQCSLTCLLCLAVMTFRFYNNRVFLEH